MSLNSKQKPLYQLATAELFPNEIRKQPKYDKSTFASDTLEKRRFFLRKMLGTRYGPVGTRFL